MPSSSNMPIVYPGSELEEEDEHRHMMGEVRKKGRPEVQGGISSIQYAAKKAAKAAERKQRAEEARRQEEEAKWRAEREQERQCMEEEEKRKKRRGKFEGREVSSDAEGGCRGV